MTKKLEVYKCELCGNIVEMAHGGNGQLVCCGQPMKIMEEKTADFKNEKHVPVLEFQDGKVRVVIGSTPHPMEEKHYIEWIQVNTSDGKSYRKFLKPGDAPEAVFEIKEKKLIAREYCNIHGLWKEEK